MFKFVVNDFIEWYMPDYLLEKTNIYRKHWERPTLKIDEKLWNFFYFEPDAYLISCVEYLLQRRQYTTNLLIKKDHRYEKKINMKWTKTKKITNSKIKIEHAHHKKKWKKRKKKQQQQQQKRKKGPTISNDRLDDNRMTT